MSATYVTKLEPEVAARLQARMEAEGFTMREVAHASFAGAGAGVQVVHYKSGKLVVQGKGVQDFKATFLLELMGESAPALTARASSSIAKTSCGA